MNRRVLIVLAGLVVVGAIAGGLCALLAINLSLLLEGPYDGPIRLDAVSLKFGAFVMGAALGAVLTPLASFLFLRKVPLGRAIAACAFGTMLGAVAGDRIWGFNPYDADLTPGVVQGAFLGFLVTNLALWLLYRRTGAVVTRDRAI
jgi:predicted acyltransferase